jgi:hypothetical protein
MHVRALRKVVVFDVHFGEKTYQRGDKFFCQDSLKRKLKGKIKVLK